MSFSRLHSLMYPFIWISIKHSGKERDTISETFSGIRLFRWSQTTLLHSLITMSKFTILVLWLNNTHRSHFYSSTVRVLSKANPSAFSSWQGLLGRRSESRKLGMYHIVRSLVSPPLTSYSLQVGDTFKLQAYAIILLRGYGYPYVQFKCILILHLLA